MSLKRLHVAFALLVLGVAAPLSLAGECARAPATERPTIGLVLGGGGARGSAHIGVIRFLEELRVPVDYVAGTSMGALVGSLYATGMRSTELEATVKAIDFDTLFKDTTQRSDLSIRRKRDDDLALYGPKLGVGDGSNLLPRGAIHGQKIGYLFETLIARRAQVSDFDDLPIPYRAVAADIVTGEAVVLGEGNLAVAMRASMSIPGAFDPVEMGDHLLVDGGIANNLPVDVARDLGADHVIAVQVGTPLMPRDKLKSLVNLTAQLSGVLVVHNTMAQIATLTEDDVLIMPALGDDIGSASFDKADEAIPIGYRGAEALREKLAKYSVSEAEYAEHRRYIEACVNSAPPPVQFVRLENDSRFDDAVIMARLHIELGKPLDETQMKSDIEQIYALDFLEQARYEVVEENGQTGVVLHVKQDWRGTNFLEWGIDLFTDGDDTAMNFRAAYLKSDVDRLGSEFRVLAQVGETPAIGVELYKYLTRERRWVFKPKVFAEQRDVNQFDERGDQTDILQVEQYGAEMFLVREIGQYGAISAGVRRFKGDIESESVSSLFEPRSFDGGEYQVDALFDRLDDRYFPGSGTRISLTYLGADSSLGADDEYEQVLAGLLTARTYGRHSIVATARYNTTLDSDAPPYVQFRGGGAFNLSGLQQEEVTGQHYGVLGASYRYHAAGSGLFPAYTGILVEYGNAADDRSDVFGEGILNGSVYFGYRSPLGPLYWGIGFAEGGRLEYFLRVGNVFGTSSIGR